MMIRLRNLLLAVAFIGVLTFGAAAEQPANPPAAAAQTAAPALPPGSPLIGRPASEAATKLSPVAPPPIAAAVDKLPTAKLKVPPGFNVEVYAAGMANARSLAEGDKGTVFVCSRLVDKVYSIVNKDGKRTVKVLASGLYRPNGVAFRNGTLYIAELSKISKIEQVEDNLVAIRILGQEAKVQTEAVKSAQQAVQIAINEYRAGTQNFTTVVTAEASPCRRNARKSWGLRVSP